MLSYSKKHGFDPWGDKILQVSVWEEVKIAWSLTITLYNAVLGLLNRIPFAHHCNDEQFFCQRMSTRLYSKLLELIAPWMGFQVFHYQWKTLHRNLCAEV